MTSDLQQRIDTAAADLAHIARHLVEAESNAALAMGRDMTRIDRRVDELVRSVGNLRVLVDAWRNDGTLDPHRPDAA